MDKLKFEICEQVIVVFDVYKSFDVDLIGKSIEDIVSYVCCFYCWSCVYRIMIFKIVDIKFEVVVVLLDDIWQFVDDKGNEKYEMNFLFVVKLS